MRAALKQLEDADKAMQRAAAAAAALANVQLCEERLKAATARVRAARARAARNAVRYTRRVAGA